MNISQLDLNLLRVFRAVVDEGSVSLGARRVGLSQPAVSSALRRLRQACGDPLLVRAQGGMQPTEYGRRLTAAIDEAFELLHGALSDRRDFDPATARTVFTLLMSDIGEAVSVPAMLRAATVIAPNVRFSIVPLRGTSYLRQLETTEADLVCGYLRNPKAGLRQQRLFTSEFVCMFRSDHPMIGEALTPQLYAALSHVAVERDGHGGPVGDLMASLGIIDQIKLTVPHSIAMPAIVLQTDLVMTTTRGLAEAYCKLGPLRWLPLPHRLPPVQVSLFWHERRHRDAANRWLRHFLRSCIAESDDVTIAA